VIPKTITAALEKLVRDRDRWKRLALDRAPVRSADRRREIAARDRAVERLLFAIDIEGLASHQSRGARGDLWDALEALRPDITETMESGLDDAGEARRRFFPDLEDLK
jgi:hypothetical protein